VVAFWHWKITVLDVGFVGAAAGFASAVLSPVTSWVVGGLQYRGERNTRIHDDRRDGYAVALRDAYTARFAIDSAVKALRANDGVRARDAVRVVGSTSDEEVADGFVRLALFGSDEVVERQAELVRLWNGVMDGYTAHSLSTARECEACADWLEGEAEKVRAAVSRLRRAVRDDLTK
jgi:hypothetical protein